MRCNHCGHEFVGQFGSPCPACGQITRDPFAPNAGGQPPPGGPQANPWATPQAQGPEDGRPEQMGGGIPWEEEQSAQSMFETIKVVLVETADTFAAARRDAGIGAAFVYALILGTVGGVIGSLWSFLITPGGQGAENLPEGLEGLAMLTQPGIGQILLAPVQVIFGLFILTAIVHVLLMLVKGADAGFEATFRVVAYTTGSVAVLQLIPILGPLVGGIWGLVIEILGLKEIHGTTGGKAAFAVLFPILLCCCCVMTGVFAAVGAIGQNAGSF